MPPILFVRVYEMILNSGFPKNVQHFLGKLHLMSATYHRDLSQYFIFHNFFYDISECNQIYHKKIMENEIL